MTRTSPKRIKVSFGLHVVDPTINRGKRTFLQQKWGTILATDELRCFKDTTGLYDLLYVPSENDLLIMDAPQTRLV